MDNLKFDSVWDAIEEDKKLAQVYKFFSGKLIDQQRQINVLVNEIKLLRMVVCKLEGQQK